MFLDIVRSFGYIAGVVYLATLLIVLGLGLGEVSTPIRVILVILILPTFSLATALYGSKKREPQSGIVPNDQLTSSGLQIAIDEVLGFDQIINLCSSEIDRCRRYDRQFSVLLFMASYVLPATSKGSIDQKVVSYFLIDELSKRLRLSDISGWGPSVATVFTLLPETDEEDALAAVRRIRVSIADLQFPFVSGEKVPLRVNVKAFSYPVDFTDSVGLTDLLAAKEIPEH
ncbi:MAG: hypothetical protein HQ477_01160 [Chloroflexi bacterium]|nr:hypothetical protein [Chloroflexota bacterium]